MPRRIQRRRTKGWRLTDATTSPLGAVTVSRPSRFGNPARIVRADHGLTVRWGNNGPSVGTWPADGLDARQYATELYTSWINAPEQRALRALACELLPGRDLACWCPLPAEGKLDHCHAAVQIAFVNEHLLRQQFGPVATGRLTGPQQNTAVDAYTLIQAADGPGVARAWMIGMNPHLDDTAPLLAIQEGRGHDVLAAARAYTKDLPT